MHTNSKVAKAVIDLHKQGVSIIKIAKILNLHIEEVVDIINEYT
jgi:hypothetical protein